MCCWMSAVCLSLRGADAANQAPSMSCIHSRTTERNRRLFDTLLIHRSSDQHLGQKESKWGEAEMKQKFRESYILLSHSEVGLD